MRGQLERIVFWSLIPSENLIAVYLFEYKKNNYKNVIKTNLYWEEWDTDFV